MPNLIQFIPNREVLKEYEPKPAVNNLPEWYKKQEGYKDGKPQMQEDGLLNTTVKKCMPFFDAMTFGYLIFNTSDITVVQKDGKPYYYWKDDSVNFHENNQFLEHKLAKSFSAIPKFTNPYTIITPKGYSCFFTTPIHHDLPFTVLEGVVDTDSGITGVPNIVFALNNPLFEGVIPAGTPMVQVIPFKREDWKMKITTKDKFEKEKTRTKLIMTGHISNAYKNFFWKKKEFK